MGAGAATYGAPRNHVPRQHARDRIALTHHMVPSLYGPVTNSQYVGEIELFLSEPRWAMPTARHWRNRGRASSAGPRLRCRLRSRPMGGSIASTVFWSMNTGQELRRDQQWNTLDLFQVSTLIRSTGKCSHATCNETILIVGVLNNNFNSTITPATPTEAFPGAPYRGLNFNTGASPATPTGASPATPTGAYPVTPTGASPATPYNGNSSLTLLPNHNYSIEQSHSTNAQCASMRELTSEFVHFILRIVINTIFITIARHHKPTLAKQ